MRIRSLAIGILCAAGAWGQAYTITTIAGNGTTGFAGDGGPASASQLSFPGGIAVDSSGNIYIADSGNNRIRKISGGTITTVAGNGTAGYSGDNGPATSAELNNPTGIAVDAAGNLYIADTVNQVVRQVNPAGKISTIAGENGAGAGYSGDTGTAVTAQLNSPTAVVLDSSGNIYIADSGNNTIREITAGTINTVSATSGTVVHPDGVAVDGAGNLYVADTDDRRVIEVSNGVFSVVAGNEAVGFAGDDGLAVNAKFDDPFGVAVDSAGYVYIADTFNSRIRKVALDGTVSTIAGTGYPAYFGDGGQATSASLYFPHETSTSPIPSTTPFACCNYRRRRSVRRGSLTRPVMLRRFRLALSARCWDPISLGSARVPNPRCRSVSEV
jgi:sugar lactone lactonase YvrE